MNVLISLLMFFTIGCKNNKEQSEILKKSKEKYQKDVNLVEKQYSVFNKDKGSKSIKEVNYIVPDSTINRKLFLSNYNSLQNFYSDYENITTIDRIRESPVVIFMNKSKAEYLIAYQYEGVTKNAFDCFEIGFLNNEQSLNNITILTTSEENFRTETDLRLGMTLEKLKSIKGSNYEKQEKESQTILTYRNTDFKTSSFLKRYNMPSYFMEFTLKENKIIKIKFGFDYP